MNLLREREAVPDARLTDLGRRRVEAARERLVAAEGIPETRLTIADPVAPAAPSGADARRPPAEGGRVEFAVVVGE